jgi:hypothetical protein
MRACMQRGALLASMVMCPGAGQTFAADDLTGIWSAEVRTRGGLGAQMTFTATEVTSTFGALVDIKYEIDGKEFTIDGDKMTVTRAGGPPQVMTRVGAPHGGGHPIIGDWSFMHYTGQPAVQRFSRNGTSQLTVPFQTTKGPYRVDNGTLQIQFEGRPAVVLKVKRDGNVLTTTDSNGKEIRFIKFEY